MSEFVTLKVDGYVARLTLNRPEAGNAIDVALARALYDAVIACSTNENIRCIILAGNGRMFCAGGDVTKLTDAGKARPSMLKEILAYLHPAIALLARMDKPVITVINGPAAGAGLSLAIVGDIALASTKASFTPAYSGIGLSPDAGVTWLLPRLIGLRRSQEVFLTNQRISAEEAATMGLVTRVVPEGKLDAEVERVAQNIVESATAALGTTKGLLLDSGIASLEAHMDSELKAIVRHGAGSENAEGLKAFAERRKPNFLPK